MRIAYTKGQKIGECIFVSDAETSKNTDRRAIFECKCGKEFTTTIVMVKKLVTRSCGCLHREQLIKRNSKHGLRYLKEYSLWLNMKQRCTNPNFTNFKNWGGRGITMCDRWLNSFEAFYEDMGNQPAKRMAIDRIDNEKGYSKENCRWATQKQNNNNTRKNRMIEFNGKIQSLTDWCDELKLRYAATAYHCRRGIKTIEEIFDQSKILN